MQRALEEQGLDREQVLIVDSSSPDNTAELARKAGFRVETVLQRDFLHGATRQMAANLLPQAQFLVYLTQDAIPANHDAIPSLIQAFDDPTIGAAYGRQLPREGANPVERHARLFNYSPKPEIRDLDSRAERGFKATFFSNSFAAYRRTAFDEVGGFPKAAIVSEDMAVVGRMLVAGWRVAYQADATVIHSHNLTMLEEIRRYFDIGVQHSVDRWLLETFGGASGEGLAFLRSELQYLRQTSPQLIPIAMVRNVGKWCSYKLGLHENRLPMALKKRLSAQPNYWRPRST